LNTIFCSFFESAVENETLSLLIPPPQECLSSWLTEIYGKPVEIERRTLLRHRDLSFVERLWLKDTVPRTLIYKVVLPPWDIERDLHEKILIPSVSNSARLYLSADLCGATVMLVEDFGEISLLDSLKSTKGLPELAGREIARFHRAYSLRVEEMKKAGILRIVLPADFVQLASEMEAELDNQDLISRSQLKVLSEAAETLADRLAAETISLVHGDLYAENLLFDGENLHIIDWSWFARISMAILDLATVSMNHFKNGELSHHGGELVEAYCREYGRDINETCARLPYAEMATRFMFLEWLVERRRRGIMGTTVGPVDILISTVLKELSIRLRDCAGKSD
jgi:thiamine kinase-like enzyme